MYEALQTVCGTMVDASGVAERCHTSMTRIRHYVMLLLSLVLTCLYRSGHLDYTSQRIFDASSSRVTKDPKSKSEYAPRGRCAISFYGLPRSFKLLVLPSVEANIIVPNIHYDCDYFVHIYNVTFEPPSRSSAGGPIMPEDVYLLREAVHNHARRAGRDILPYVGFAHHSVEEFERNHSALLAMIRNETNNEKNPFIGKVKGYTVETHANVIKMWHSISAVWDTMKDYASSHNVTYERVGMLRVDVVFITPIDIFQTAQARIVFNATNRTIDTGNNTAVVPSFSKFPVNDRMFYGPYEAAELWSTGRFQRLNHFVYKLRQPLHSEKFLGFEIFPAIQDLGFSIGEDHKICFLLARADGSIWNDCGGLSNKAIVEKLVNMNCSTRYHWLAGKRSVLQCPDQFLDEKDWLTGVHRQI